MAKHIIDGKGTASKGKRISCYGNAKKHAIIIATTERVESAMRQAFLNIKVASEGAYAAKVVGHILNSAKQNAGNNRYGRGWTANVSAKTLKQLTQQGVFA